MAGEETLVTIATPTFYSARVLPNAISSIMSQGLDDFEDLPSLERARPDYVDINHHSNI